MPFTLLSEPIRKYIREKRWEELRPIQNAAIKHILTTENHYILASRTASGKTEAAFLPVLSKVNFNDPGVQVLYISPLIALINDQFFRIEELLKNMEVPVTKWHGEASRTLKEHLIKNPSGVVLITPESIEAMLANKPYNAKALFANLKFVVIDEIHSFIGSDRGTQLKSILSRLQDINKNTFRIVGLSATLGDFAEAKKFTGNSAETIVLKDSTAKEINAVFKYFEKDGDDLPLELFKDLYLQTKDKKVLIFPNSRGITEVIAVKLRKISDRVNGHKNYFSHHSSVDREVREYVEFFAKNNKHQNFAIACTSTLELGIDIGTVDEVVQIDATHSIASLIQRVGRSGRREGAKSNLLLYSSDHWSLLQSLACWLLYQEQFIEPPLITNKPYDILLHQALSITKGHSGINSEELVKQLRSNFAFPEIAEEEIRTVLEYLTETDLLEKLGYEVIIGIEGEKIVNSRDFYSVFKTEENFKVVNSGNRIGEIPYTPQVVEDENIFLAARIWKIISIDFKSKKIEVIPTSDGKKPTFNGGGASIHSRIREKMFEVLYTDKQYEFLNEETTEELQILKAEFAPFEVRNIKSDRLLWQTEKNLTLFSFTGTRTNKTLSFLLKINGIENFLDDKTSSIELKCTKSEFKNAWINLRKIEDIDSHIAQLLEDAPGILEFSKWGIYLPVKFKVELVKNRYFDFVEANYFIESTKFIENQ